MSFVFQPTPAPSVSVVGQTERFPVRRIYCVGRNYEEHAKEMGFTGREPPFFFLKPADALVVVNEGEVGHMHYPSLTQNFHHEIELVLKISKEGKYIQPQFAHRYFDEIGLGIDFTARDLQDQCKAKGLPWEIAKAFNGSAPIGDFKSVAEFSDLKNIDFHLEINGEVKQKGNTSLMLFDFATIISYVSQFFTLKKGDLIYTGTPAGVGPVQTGDQLIGFIGNEKMLHVEVK
jgi:2-keto-4-pentenoate hydratase/2-oxohepta-3-ene-1,7-dioic acid hydratase in catechol pathway